MTLKIGNVPTNGFQTEIQNNILSKEKQKGNELLSFSLEEIIATCPRDVYKILFEANNMSYLELNESSYLNGTNTNSDITNNNDILEEAENNLS
jgi:hypothetical protein